MTLVLQTEASIDNSSMSTIKTVLRQHGLSLPGDPLIMGEGTFYYLEIGHDASVTQLIQQLMSLPGVAAAYTKPMGSPPM